MRRSMALDYSHREALAAIDATELTRLKETSDRPGLLHLAGHVGLLILTGAAVATAPNWPLWFLAALIHGIVLVFLFTLEHEAIHGTAFRSSWLNAACSGMAGFLVLLPPHYFRYFHFAHHRFTQDAAHDPELITPKPRNWLEYLRHLSGLPDWFGQTSVILNNALARRIGAFVPAGGRSKTILEARIMLLTLATLAGLSAALHWTWPLELWIAPALLGQPFLRAFLLAEHGACPMVEDMLINSRTTFTNSIVRFLGWNMPFHTAHHALPVVPFHQLPALTTILRERLASTANGYIAAHRQIRAGWTANS
jgi:fatty acid desaturase